MTTVRKEARRGKTKRSIPASASISSPVTRQCRRHEHLSYHLQPPRRSQRGHMGKLERPSDLHSATLSKHRVDDM